MRIEESGLSGEELLQKFNIIRSLSVEFSIILRVNLESEKAELIARNERFDTMLGTDSAALSYEALMTRFTRRMVLQEDRELMREALSLAHIRARLAELPYYRVTYRNDLNEYCEMKCARGEAIGSDRSAVIGFSMNDEQIRDRKQVELENKRNYEIIQVLASEYSSVYHIDLTTDELNPYSMNEDTESAFGKTFRSGIRYSDAFRLYVDSFILPEDKAMMLKAGSIGNIMMQLKYKKTFLTTYRSNVNGEPHYCEMKFVKVGSGGVPREVALGFADKDEELRAKQEEAIVRQRNVDIIQILASEYSSVYYIDLTTGALTPYTMNEETESEFGQIFRSGIQYINAFNMYVNTLVYAPDRAMMLRAGSIYNILSELQGKKTFLTKYRSDNGGHPHYCEMKFVKVGESDNPHAVALGFADKDEEIRSEMERKQETDRNMAIISALASEYTSVYLVNLTSDELTPYSMNRDTETAFGEVFRSGIQYSEAYEMYVDRFVKNEYKKQMQAAGTLSNIARQLAARKSFTTTYQNHMGRYSWMKFVKVDDENEEPTVVALGFADKDEEIRKEMEKEAVIGGLSEDFGCVVYVNTDTYEETHYRFDRLFERHIPGWQEITSFSQRLDKLMSTVMHPDDVDEFRAATRLPVISKEIHKENAYFVNFRTLIDGEITYYQAKFVKDETSDNHIIVGFHNVDEETRREMEGKERLQQDFSIIEILASEYSSVYYIDLDTDELHPYTMNEETQSEFGAIFRSGIKYSDAYAMYVDKIVYEEDKRMMLEAGSIRNIIEKLSGTKTFLTTYRSNNEDAPHYCEMKFVKVGKDDDAPTAVALGFADKDEEIRRERERRQELISARRKAEAASSAKSTFLFNMSHDIRTPMNVIMGFTDLAISELSETEKALESLKKVKASSEHLLSLINDILDMSRIEAGRLELHESLVDLGALESKTVSIMRDLAVRKSIRIVTDSTGIKNKFIYTDPLRLNQVLINIISNAVKYTPEGGTVTLTITQRPGGGENTGLYCFTVADTGIGMSKEFLGTIFTSFARERTSTVSKQQGTGLGLTIAKSIVDMMQGTITVESEERVGSTFIVKIPFRVQPDPVLESKPEELTVARIDGTLNGIRVLLVEDNQLNMEISKQYLTKAGAAVEEAADGCEAVELLQEKGPDYYDCILMDIQMPVMDGYEATKYIRDMYPEKHLPIIALSANAFEEDRKASFAAGMDEHIAKPIDVDKLVKTIRMFL